MSDLAIQSSPSATLPLPAPRRAIEIVPATMEDVDWIDSLQKRHRDRVGFQMRQALEGKVRLGQIIVARSRGSGVGCRVSGEDEFPRPETRNPKPERLGYCMASDRYMKREDCGIIYQMNIEPHAQRGFVGAALLKAQFERSAYGVRLYCCWCAQDVEANRFWEAMGFVPLAYRAGSERRRRVHIFWQKRIREGDAGEHQTPWWFPSQTQGGSMEDRLVLPIPPGTHWSDAVPMILPGSDRGTGPPPAEREPSPMLEEKKHGRGARATVKAPDKGLPTHVPLSGGLCFAAPATAPAPVAEAEKSPRPKREKRKNDPKLVSAARELRDRYLEHVNGGQLQLAPAGKYQVSRQIAAAPAAAAGFKTIRLLGAA